MSLTALSLAVLVLAAEEPYQSVCISQGTGSSRTVDLHDSSRTNLVALALKTSVLGLDSPALCAS